MYSIDTNLKNNSYNSSCNILFRILKKNNITLREATHLRQPLPTNAYDIVYDFIYNIIKIKKKLNIKDVIENIKRIINIDENQVYL